ncbi:L-proline dehydrogenase /delta-1-pyrroline-5-carboxylate dehydrogenase [Tibeticola sediminis]|uniref:Bifunctional protein PutA n=2 Tax=Tibeticola sediminis TaxID=1917811 RepID=A0A3N4UHM4_9BURK|nr:L-proline dehydrogenase /delta-1-pyrroline-5-carboxylate dehydrogenase [Tibeticola sediminis]
MMAHMNTILTQTPMPSTPALQPSPNAAQGPAFAALAAELAPLTPLLAALAEQARAPEAEMLAPLLEEAALPPEAAAAVRQRALALAAALRAQPAGSGRAGLVQGLLQEFSLSSQEGVALMCLAEALLRIPDAATRDALIRDKIGRGQWQQHLGRSPSPFVNAAAWGLLITGRLVATHSEGGLKAALARILAKGGEPLVRKGVDMAMRLMGEQFVLGQTIAEALARARTLEAQGFRHSYDMLGEAALTDADAERYFQAYAEAINAIGAAAQGRGVRERAGISIKLSALHPRYSRSQRARVLAELYPRLRTLARLARAQDIGLNIDAEESERLELSLELLARLCAEPDLAGWDGIGFVVQAYQKRSPAVIDALIALARQRGQRLMVRLVKGAYWDAEIKRAQLDGMDDYPVWTRKTHTDVCYLACARRLLAAADAVYPQFATHNAHTVAAIVELAGPDTPPQAYEFQCLHGMGEALYAQVVAPPERGGLGRPCRIYAPVGTHETLLAYLVRRLLENGANTSFVHRLADPAVPLEDLVTDPVAAVREAGAREGAIGLPHARIPAPPQLYGAARRNSAGLDLACEAALHALLPALQAACGAPWRAEPLLAQPVADAIEAGAPVRNPARSGETVGEVREASAADIDAALQAAERFAPEWAAVPAAERARRLEAAADALEAQRPALLARIVREAGRTLPNAVAEVREAVDFLRYYAAQARGWDAATHEPLGPVVCISPWNFPLAIFLGQVAAALAAGNPVLAKPAEQTPVVAAEAGRLLHAAGIPRAALQLLIGDGRVGAALVADARVRGVVFTGSTEVARRIHQTLAARADAAGGPIPLIAETGGQNAMIVDSSALAEQVVTDAVTSAFDSAGQRCSALRVLCVQEEVADTVLTMLRGAMAALRLGSPEALSTDVGPVIDAEARSGIERHIDEMRRRGHPVWQDPAGVAAARALPGHYVPPTLIEIERIEELEREVFGPVLHILRYPREALDALLEAIHSRGYGLTMGLHTRIDETIAQVSARARVGNLYVNRNMIGAVVGVQPFGGEGLSGTGPKAGGPLYLLRLLARRPDGAARDAVRAAGRLQEESTHTPPAPLLALQAWAQGSDRSDAALLVDACERYAQTTASGLGVELVGPTGERNTYRTLGRQRIASLAHTEADRLLQLATTLAVGSRALWPSDAAELRATLPPEVQAHIDLAGDWLSDDAAALPPDAKAPCDAVLLHAPRAAWAGVAQALAQRPGALVPLVTAEPGDAALPLERLLLERALSVNTAAAGGNASLMMLG